MARYQKPSSAPAPPPPPLSLSLSLSLQVPFLLPTQTLKSQTFLTCAHKHTYVRVRTRKDDKVTRKTTPAFAADVSVIHMLAVLSHLAPDTHQHASTSDEITISSGSLKFLTACCFATHPVYCNNNLCMTYHQ